MGENICKWWDWQGINFQNIQTAHTIQQQQQKPNNPIKKRAEDLNRHFSKEEIHMANKHMKRCSNHKWKLQWGTYHLTLVRVTIIRKSTSDKCWRECVEKKTLLYY